MSEKNTDKDVEEMTADLEEYYEAAGFEDFYERVLSKMNESQIREYYHDTFEANENHELEEWERSFNGEWGAW